ncbi:MAG: hypothetical protein WBV69_10170 [Candidatus Sulfotelmatobacter sp.]
MNTTLMSLYVPAALLLIGAAGRTLIAGEFRWNNLYLGPDFCLAAISAGLLNFLDMFNAKDPNIGASKVGWGIGYVLVTLGIYMVVLIMHQNIEKRHTNPRTHSGVTMGLFANFFGLIPNFLFVWLKLKGML